MNGAAWGGSEELWHEAALYAARKGAKVGCAVYYWEEKKAKMQQLQNAGCSIYYLPNKGQKNKTLAEKIQFKINKKFTLKKFLKRLPVDEYELTVINQGELEITTSVWSNFYKRLPRFVLTFHNYNEQYRFKKSQAGILNTWLRHSALNFFASQRIAAVLERELHITIQHKEILINPITFDTPAEPSAFPPLSEGKYVFVMPAALDVNRKAQDQLIIALSSDKWKRRNWLLYLYGAGKDEALLQQLIIKLELSDKVFLKGHTNNMQGVLAESHLVLHITRMDAMPISVVEAMAMSRPLIVSVVGDMPLWVKEGENGWICSQAMAADIDAVLEKAWNGREQWPLMALASFHIFKNRFPALPAGALFLQQIKKA